MSQKFWTRLEVHVHNLLFDPGIFLPNLSWHDISGLLNEQYYTPLKMTTVVTIPYDYASTLFHRNWSSRKLIFSFDDPGTYHFPVASMTLVLYDSATYFDD